MKDTNFNASCQRAMFRRTGWAVIWRGEKRSTPGRKRGVGVARWVCGALGLASGARARVRRCRSIRLTGRKVWSGTSEHAVVPMAVTARGRHQGRQPI